MWTNAGVLVLTLYLLKQDREILLTYHQNKKISNEDNSSSSSSSQEIKIQSPVLDSSPSVHHQHSLQERIGFKLSMVNGRLSDKKMLLNLGIQWLELIFYSSNCFNSSHDSY